MTPAVADGRVYVGSTDHFIYCLDAQTGDVVWKYETGDELRGYGAAIADGKVYMGSKDGYVYCFGKGSTRIKTIHADQKVTSGTSIVLYGMLTDLSPASLDEPLAKMPVTLTAALLGEENKEIASVETDIKGCFVHKWTPPVEGTYNLKISFAGNESYEPSSKTVILQVTTTS